MSNLYLFPELPNETSGYEIAVKSDINSYKINKEDIVVFFTEKNLDANREFDFTFYVIKRQKNLLKTIKNLFKLIHPSFFHVSDWMKIPKNIRDLRFKRVYFGDVIFYPIFTKVNCEKFEFRFHNLWLRILNQNPIISFSLKNLLNLILISRAEKKILNHNIKISLISEADMNYASKYSNNISLLEIFPETIAPKQLNKLDNFKSLPTIIWFGSVSVHKRKSLIRLINLFKTIKKDLPELSLLLFGKNTEYFDNRDIGIYSYGFYEDRFSLPVTENCIYLNPDDIGGGIKIKNYDIAANDKIDYLSTPEGFEGCENYEREGIYILPFFKWHNFLIKYFQ